VTQGVKADAGQAGALGSGNEHVTAQTSLIGRSAVAAWKDERVVFGAVWTTGSQHGR
jgi:hypothetical protein